MPALARQRTGVPAPAWVPALQTAGGPPVHDERISWLARLGLAAPLLAVAIGFVGIYEHQESRRILQLADIDFAVLLDDVPLVSTWTRVSAPCSRPPTTNPSQEAAWLSAWRMAP